jgi:hypothetical protein
MDIVAFVNQTSSKPPAARYELAKVRSHVSRTVWRRNRMQNIREHLKRRGEDNDVVLDREEEDSDALQQEPPTDQSSSHDHGAGRTFPGRINPTRSMSLPVLRHDSGGSTVNPTFESQHSSYQTYHAAHQTSSGSVPQQQHSPQPTVPYNRLPGDSFRNDPFHSLPSKDNYTMMQAFDYFTQIVSDEFAPLTNIPGVKNWITEIMIPLAIQTPHYFFSIMTSSLIARAMAKRLPFQDDPDVMYAHGESLRLLNKALTNVDDDAVPLTLIQLLTTEWQMGNKSAQLAHSNGLARILEMRGSRPKSPTTQVLDVLVALSRGSSIFQPTIAVQSNPSSIEESLGGPYDKMVPLTYPKNPLTASFVQSTPLPSAFADIIMQSQPVCFQLIQILSMAASTIEGQHDGSIGPHVEWEKLVHRMVGRFTASELHPVEQPIYYGLLAFCHQQQRYWECRNGIRHESINTGRVLDDLQQFMNISSHILSAITALPRCHEFMAWALVCILSTLLQVSEESGPKSKHKRISKRVAVFLSSQSLGQDVTDILSHLHDGGKTDDVRWPSVRVRLESFLVPLPEDIKSQGRWKAVWGRLLLSASTFNTLS